MAGRERVVRGRRCARIERGIEQQLQRRLRLASRAQPDRERRCEVAACAVAGHAPCGSRRRAARALPPCTSATRRRGRPAPPDSDARARTRSRRRRRPRRAGSRACGTGGRASRASRSPSRRRARRAPAASSPRGDGSYTRIGTRRPRVPTAVDIANDRPRSRARRRAARARSPQRRASAWTSGAVASGGLANTVSSSFLMSGSSIRRSVDASRRSLSSRCKARGLTRSRLPLHCSSSADLIRARSLAPQLAGALQIQLKRQRRPVRPLAERVFCCRCHTHGGLDATRSHRRADRASSTQPHPRSSTARWAR